MMFSSHRESIVGLLVLRHLHTGNVIDFPVPDELPQAHIFHTLLKHGHLERWGRVWPLSDRYRLTAQGVQAIQSAYRPENAEAILQQLRARNLAPAARPQALRAMGFDPNYWPILHDPHVHWMTWPELIGPYQRYIWEPELPRAAPAPRAPRPGGAQQRQARPRPDAPPPRRAGGFAPSPARPYPPHHHDVYHPSHHDFPHLHDPGGHDHGGHDAGGYNHGGYEPDPGYFEGGGGESGGGGASDGWGYETENLDGGGSGGDSGGDGSSYGDVS
jgi:uncharacterized membrane protein YgcG